MISAPIALPFAVPSQKFWVPILIPVSAASPGLPTIVSIGSPSGGTLSAALTVTMSEAEGGGRLAPGAPTSVAVSFTR